MAKISNRRCAKDGCEEFLTKMQCVRIANLQRYIGIRLKNALHLGKKFLAAIYSAIVYCGVINLGNLRLKISVPSLWKFSGWTRLHVFFLGVRKVKSILRNLEYSYDFKFLISSITTFMFKAFSFKKFQETFEFFPMCRHHQGRRERGRGHFAPGPQGLRGLIIEDFSYFDCRKCSEMHFKPI